MFYFVKNINTGEVIACFEDVRQAEYRRVSLKKMYSLRFFQVYSTDKMNKAERACYRAMVKSQKIVKNKAIKNPFPVVQWA